MLEIILMKQFTIALFIIPLLFGVEKSSAKLQGQARLDSLINELPKQKEDTNKVKVLHGLSFGYCSINPEEGIKYGQMELDLATRLKSNEYIAAANNSMASNYLYKSNYPKALEYYQAALKIDEESGYKKGIAGVNENIGNIYQFQNDYRKALEYYLKGLKIDENLGDKNDIAYDNGSIGAIYLNMNNYPKALEYNFKCLNLLKETGNKQGMAIAMGNIGNLYNKQKNYSEAIDFELQSLKIYEELENKRGIALILSGIGNSFLCIFKDTSMRYLSKKSRSDEAKNILIPTSRPALLNKAIEYLQNSLGIAKELGNIHILQQDYEFLAEAYRQKKDYKMALFYADNYRTIKDSVYSKENDEKIVKMGMKNEFDRQRLTDSLKNAEKERMAKVRLQRQRTLTYTGMAGVLILVGFSFFIVRERSKSEREREKSDNLLLNILPAEVALELKTKGTTTAKHFDNVTVLFTDFVNFTSAGERMNPQQLIDELHNCFKSFDDITAKYGIEKIKTIGDAYLAVAGLPRPDPKHAEKAVLAAIDINNFMKDRREKSGDKTFEIRIGIHSGSVVAGIVGVKKFAYDVWGDTVNTAARMEQNSAAGKINISQTTYELVKSVISCEYRGEIEAKNKGMMNMYFVS